MAALQDSGVVDKLTLQNESQIKSGHDQKFKQDELLCFLCCDNNNTNKHYDWIVKDMCQCKSVVHFRCAQKMVESHGPICKACLTPFPVNQPTFDDINKPSQKIFFPLLGIFPQPLRSNIYLPYSIGSYSFFELALIYLQPQVFQQFASMLSIQDTKKLMLTYGDKTKKFSFIHFELAPVLPSNLSREHNLEVHDWFQTFLRCHYCLLSL